MYSSVQNDDFIKFAGDTITGIFVKPLETSPCRVDQFPVPVNHCWHTSTHRYRTPASGPHYDLYTPVTDRSGSAPLSEDRVYPLEQALLGVTESNHAGGGQGEGSYL